MPTELKIKELEAQLTQAHQERDEALAACAVMREALDKVWDIEEMGYTPDDPESESGVCVCDKCEGVQHHNFKSHAENCPQPIIETALATDCGKAFLDRMKEAEWLLSQPLLCKVSGQSELVEWHARRDAFLKGGAK